MTDEEALNAGGRPLNATFGTHDVRAANWPLLPRLSRTRPHTYPHLVHTRLDPGAPM